MQDPEVELVVNLTPPRAHTQTTLAAIRAGKHVWSEKPLAPTLDEARKILEAARAADIRVGCAPDTFLGGGLQTSLKLIDDGWIGEPVAAVAMVSEHGYEHFHPDVHPFYSPGGGPALDLGPYYVTAIVAMLGPVARVNGFGRITFSQRTILTGPRCGEPIPVHVPTHVTGALELESGALVTVLMSWDIWATHLPYIEVYGTKGSVSVPNPDEFNGLPRLRRAGLEELRQPPPPPGSLPWTDVPLAFDGHGCRGLGMVDMTEAIRCCHPHRANEALAFHVLEVLCALTSQDPQTIEIKSRCERPAPVS